MMILDANKGNSMKKWLLFLSFLILGCGEPVIIEEHNVTQVLMTGRDEYAIMCDDGPTMPLRIIYLYEPKLYADVPSEEKCWYKSGGDVDEIHVHSPKDVIPGKLED